ncbi:LTA synthase family protein [Dokdonella sp.]|uniref:LTA synthase family protein n=1 Tax=Dokdonella sp. TaxID=2291710 RepID=UPI0037840E01
MDRSRMMRRSFAFALGSGALVLVLLRVWQAEADLIDRVYCVTLTGALALAVAAMSGRVAFGCLCAAALAGTIWLTSTLKLAYLHEPLFAPDVRYLAGTLLAEVVRHYPGMLRKCIAVLLLVPACAVLVWRLESPSLWLGRRRRVRSAVTLAGALVLSVCAWPHGPFRQVHAVAPWDFLQQAQRNPLTTFLRSLSLMNVTPPPHEAGTGSYDWGGAKVATAETPRPDLVAVLEESTLDPRQWSACTSPRCHFGMFDADATTRAEGLLRVHTYGGATWTSEFAFLAGLPHTLFGPAGLYAPYNLVPRLRDSLPRQLKALGYRTIAVYPMPRGFVRAAEAYAEYGFDEFHDSNELGIEWESTDRDLVAKVEEIHRRARAEDDRPLFVMVLTMRQHGPHDKPLDALPPPWNESPAPSLDERANRNLGTYLYRMHQSDQALAELRRYLFAAGRPAVFAHFGDHHPSFDGIESRLASALPAELASGANTLTYYRIDSSIEGAPLPAAPPLDLAFLGGLMLDVAGLPKDAYFEANTRLRERCNGRFEGCAQADVLPSFYAYAFGTLKVFDE